MIISISGTPGTGKTTLAQILAKKFKMTYIDVTNFISQNKLHDKYDRSLKTYIIDVDKVEKKLKKEIEIKENYIIDSHFSHDFSFVTHCIVCTCERKILRNRLLKRKYSEKKIMENIQSEIFDTCYIEALENKKKTIKIDCTTKKSIDYKKIEEFISS